MSYRYIGIEEASFGADRTDGTQYSLGSPTVEIAIIEDTPESGFAIIRDGESDLTVSIDQMVSEYETAIVRITIAEDRDWDQLKALQATHVAVRLVDGSGKVCVLPHCLHDEVRPPVATFTAQDIPDPANGRTYWAIVNDEKIYGEKKVDFSS